MEFLTSWAHANAIVVSAAILVVAYIFIATEKIPKMTVALVGLNTCLHSVLTNLLAASQIFIFPVAAPTFTARTVNSASPF